MNKYDREVYEIFEHLNWFHGNLSISKILPNSRLQKL